MSREMMSTIEVVEYLGISRSRLYEPVKEHKIPFARPGQRKLIFPKALVDERIEWKARSNFDTADGEGPQAQRKIHALAQSHHLADRGKR